MSSEDAIANLKAVIEAQDRELDAMLERVRDEFRAQLAAETDILVERAQTAWDEGRSFLSLCFSDGRRTPGLKEWPQLRNDYRIMNEANWGDALGQITAIGWRLHTWVLGERESRFVPVPLFERPNR